MFFTGILGSKLVSINLDFAKAIVLSRGDNKSCFTEYALDLEIYLTDYHESLKIHTEFKTIQAHNDFIEEVKKFDIELQTYVIKEPLSSETLLKIQKSYALLIRT